MTTASTISSNPSMRSLFTLENFTQLLIGGLSNSVQKLHGLGYKKLVMHGMRRSRFFFKCGEKNQGKFDESVNNVKVYYNDLLSNMTKELERQLPGIKLTQSQIFNSMRNLLEHPQESGLRDGYDSCCVEDEMRDYIEGKIPCRNRQDFISL